jgi:hypothetical protein
MRRGKKSKLKRRIKRRKNRIAPLKGETLSWWWTT